MIDRQNGDIVFECDECGEVFESATSDFNSAWNQAKRDGWRVRKIGTEWVHECPNCH
jgi:Fe2+ or Zn2+ uptake regulation protein